MNELLDERLESWWLESWKHWIWLAEVIIHLKLLTVRPVMRLPMMIVIKNIMRIMMIWTITGKTFPRPVEGTWLRVVTSSEQLYIFVDLPLGSRICDWKWSCLQSRIPRSSWSTLWESLSKGCQTLHRPWPARRRGPCQKRWGSLCKPWRTWSAGRSPSYALNKQP